MQAYTPQPVARLKPFDARALLASAAARLLAFVAFVLRMRDVWRKRLAAIVRPILSDSTDWCALPLGVRVLVMGGVAHRDSMAVTLRDGHAVAMGWIVDSVPDYPKPPLQPILAPAAPRFDTAPLVKARERKEAELLVKILPEADCLHIDAAPAPVAVKPNGAHPEPVAEHVLTPLMLIDGKPETAEAQARRRASCSLRAKGEKRSVFYYGKEGAVTL